MCFGIPLYGFGNHFRVSGLVMSILVFIFIMGNTEKGIVTATPAAVGPLE